MINVPVSLYSRTVNCTPSQSFVILSRMPSRLHRASRQVDLLAGRQAGVSPLSKASREGSRYDLKEGEAQLEVCVKGIPC